MLWTLWRAILFDFLKLLLLTTAVVAATIVFATTIKPLSDGKITPTQALKFMGLAIPPMLAYALPFAAGFSATITYHRISSENEATAIYASGISHKRFLFPMLVSGVMIGGSLFALNNWVIPGFLHRMQEMVTRDFAQIFVNSLRRGESATVGKTEIHADVVEEIKPEPNSPVRDLFLLGGVAMVEADEQGVVQIDGTAKRAWIEMRPVWSLDAEDRTRIGDDNAMVVIMKFQDMSVNRSGSLGTSESFTSPAIPIPNVFEDNPKFMTSKQMAELRKNPDEMNFVDRKREDLARAIAAHRARTTLGAQARDSKPLVFHSPSGETISVLSGRVRDQSGTWRLDPIAATGSVEVEIISADGRVNRLQAQDATLGTQSPSVNPFSVKSLTPGLDFTLTMQRVLVLGPPDSAIPPTERNEIELTSLRVENDPLTPLLGFTSKQMLDEAQVYRSDASLDYAQPVAAAADSLERTILDLRREIASKLNERWAFTAAGFMMVISGAITALRLRYAQPLVVYLWSFFPALGTIMLISGGQQVAQENTMIGLPFQWLGVALLCVYTASAYRKVVQN